MTDKNKSAFSEAASPNPKYNDILKTPRRVYVTRKVHFNAAHRLFNPNFSDERNSDIYDVCNNFYGHGHNYDVEVTLAGSPDPETGYLFDLKLLKKILEEEILTKVDHKHLNFDTELFRNAIPTAEVIAIVFWDVLQKKLNERDLKRAKLYAIKVYESERNFVEYRGE